MKKFNLHGVLLLAMALTFFTACQQEDEVAPLKLSQNDKIAYVGDPGVTDDITNGGGTIQLDINGNDLYHVFDFFQGVIDTEPADPHDRASTYYFRLVNNEGGSSGTHDLKFTGMANGNIYPGSGETLAYVDEDFSTVSIADYNVSNERAYFGYNTGSNIGWYNYNVSTHILTAVTGRTLILKRDLGNSTFEYYKIKVISIYEGAAPDTNFAATDFPYFTFDYQKL